jgi:tripartite-type tricarboxylate transporter receptor subunit TctC
MRMCAPRAMLAAAYRVSLFAGLGLAALAVTVAPPAQAQTPGHTISIIVPYTPASGPDILGRLLGDEISKRWKQPVVVENKPGASGNIGTQFVARAAPDGNTIVVVSNPFTANISLLKSVPYDPIKSFEPIIEPALGSLALTVNKSVPAKNVQEFVAYMKAHPNEVTYSSPGIGTPHHLAMELLNSLTHTKARHIPYRGSAGATQDLLAGHVQAGFQAIHVIKPLVADGNVRLLGLGSLKRSEIAPDLPTLDEQGIKGFEVDLWYGVLAPKGTPQAVIDRYNTTINEILKDPKVKATLAKQGLSTAGGTPDRLAKFLVTDIAKWKQVIKDAGITPQ